MVNLHVPVRMDPLVHPVDPPLHVAVIHSVALITVLGRVTIVVCQHGGKMRTGSASFVRSLPLRRSAFYPQPGV